MVYGQIDPARLEGDALTRWYLRSPDDIEQERQEAAAQRYQDFFGSNRGVDPDPGFKAGLETPTQDVDPGFDGGDEAPANDVDPELSWVQVGLNRWRSVNASDDMSPDPGADASISQAGATFDGAGEGDGSGPRLAIGNQFRPRPSVAALSAPSSAVITPRATPGLMDPPYRRLRVSASNPGTWARSSSGSSRQTVRSRVGLAARALALRSRSRSWS